MKKTIKYLLLAVVILNNQIFLADKDKPIKLENPLLRISDGAKGMIDVSAIYKMSILCKKTNIFQYGTIDKKTKERKPQHEFQSKLYTLEELVEIEEKLRQEKNNNTQEYRQKVEELNILKKKLKDEMMSILEPFLIDARGAYSLMVALIQESCQKRNRPDSEMLKWDPKNERVSFDNRITSIKKLSEFCKDLVNLQKDIVYSCPKATSMYDKWLKAQRKK